jgi:outer membrane protein insertion porin family
LSRSGIDDGFVRLKGFTFIFALFVFALAPMGAAKAALRHVPDLTRYEGRTVASIEVTVEEASVEGSALAEFRAVLKIAEGARFSAVLVRDSLQSLFDTNRVAGARVEARDAPGAPGADGRPRVALRFVIKPQVLLGDVQFEVGVTAGTGITEDELRGRINLLEPGRRLTRQAIERNADLIQTYLRDRGFYRAEVTHEQRLDPTRTRATVIFRVEPGPPTLVDAFNIKIEGFNEAPVIPQLKLQRGARFTQEALGQDIARIRDAVLAEGRLAPRLEEPDVRLDSEKNLITITLAGAVGPQVTVNITGYELSDKRKRELLPILREGSVEFSAIVEGERRLENRLQEEGYFFADVTHACSVQPPFATPTPITAAPPATSTTATATTTPNTATTATTTTATPATTTTQTATPANGEEELDTCEILSPEDLTGRAVTINYTVERGRRFELTNIRIEGTDKLSFADVEEDLRSREANVLGLIPFIGLGRGYTNADALERDRRFIEARMRDLGHRRANVTVRQGVSVAGDNLIITFAVEEGPLTRVAGIEVRGNQIYTAQKLREERCPSEPTEGDACLAENGPYSRSQARTDAERMRGFYSRNGYLDADVDLDVVELPPDRTTGDERVRLIYTVDEADKVFINRIIVNGIVRTKREAVVDAIPLRENEVLRGDELAESERILLNTADAFRQVLIRTEDAGETSGGFKKKDVIIDVEERKRITTDYIIGFSTDNGPLGGFEIRNTNLFGQLRQGAFRSRFSGRQQLVRFEYFDPRFQRYGKKDFAPLTASLQYQRDTSVTRFFRSTLDRGNQGLVQRFDADGNLIDEFGASVKEPSINRLTFNLETQRDLELDLSPTGAVRKRSTIFLRYNYEDVRLFNIGSLLIAPILRPDQVVRLSRFGASFARDTRDRQFDPTRGDFVAVDYALALKPLGGSLSFNKLLTTYRRYYKINRVRETIFAGSVQFGLAKIINPTDRNDDGVINEADKRLPISERFFSGGSTTLRGFGFEEAGPRVVVPDCVFGSVPPAIPIVSSAPCGSFRNQKGELVTLNPFTVPIGGNAMAIVNLEARVGLTRDLQAVPFYDGGNVFESIRDIFGGKDDPARLNPNFRAKWAHTVGLGLRFKTPVGALAVDYGYLLNPPEFLIPQNGGGTAIHRLKNSQLHFRFGQTF